MDTPELYKLSDRIWWGNWAAFRRASVDARALISIAHAEQLHHRLKPFKVRTGAPYFWLPREDERPVCRAYMATLDTVADLINRERMYPAFVHCLAGHHRSPAVAAYLEWSAGERTLERAAAACQRVNDLLPTPGFHAFSRSLHDHIYDLAQHGHRTLPWPKKEPTAMLTATTYEQQYYDEHKAHGLDYLGHGTWQRDYGHWFVAALGLHNKRILDAGCACGSIALGLARAGASVVGADISRYMIALGKSTWPHLELHQADLADLFMLAD
ncbi:MAG: methyltransferase domain-containing protein, partial [Pirellulales bacterium]